MRLEPPSNGLIPLHLRAADRAREPSMVSHAANAEDVVLERAFSDRFSGFYIDVGACHPSERNTTHHFYTRNWYGVNVEPDRELHAAFVQARSRDTNVAAAVGSSRRRVTFYPTGERGAGTLQAELAADRGAGRPPEAVPMITLDDVFDCYVPQHEQVDFLRIDVGGGEADVIAGCDWRKHRPRVILVAALDKHGAPAHEAWEPALLAGGFALALFDGVNRFYYRVEDAGLLPSLAIPANARDRWVRFDEQRAQAAAARARSEAAAAERRLNEIAVAGRQSQAELERKLAALQLMADSLNAQAETDRVELAGLRVEHARIERLADEADRARTKAAAALRREAAGEARLTALTTDFIRRDAEIRALRERESRQARDCEHLTAQCTELHARLRVAEASLAAVLGSTSWSFTRPFRVAGQLLRERTPVRRVLHGLRMRRNANR